jgi:agmatine/peptidylarginine deiminase
MNKIFLVFVILLSAFLISAEDAFLRKLAENPYPYHYLSLEEYLQKDLYVRDFQPTDPPEGEVRQIAEFDQMEGVLVVYPLGIPVSAVAEMSQHTKVYTIVTAGNQNACSNYFTSNGVNMANCVFINSATNTYWVRDYGPWFISRDHQIEIVDFPYNRPRPLDDEIPIVTANYLGINYYGMSIETAGGNYMCDGNYIGASTDLVYDENPGLTPAQIDQLVLDYLGIEEYHVTIDPLGDYIKHIDCWGKFLDVDKVLIGQVPSTDPRYNNFEFVADYYANQTSAWGNNYQVYRIYTPGGNPPTPYTNSLILNKKVFVPITGSQWDDEALATYEAAMPGYQVVPVQSNGWYNTDALHCRTKGVADREMLYISHLPILGDQDYQDSFQIEAKIIPYSNQPVFEDSLIVYYKINEGNFEPIIMNSAGDNIYTAEIPGQLQDTVVSYYIYAADHSGKNANHPYIGQFDPHEFTVISSPIPAELVVNPTSISLQMEVDETDIVLLVLSNIGGLPLSFTLSEEMEWLSANHQSGIVNGGESFAIILTINTTGLIAGDYSGEIIINDDREETIIPVSLTVTGTGAPLQPSSCTEFLGNYPNPFNPTTTIRFTLANQSQVNLSIYNLRGQKVRSLINEQRTAGFHQVIWDGTDDNGLNVSSGVYFSVFDVHDDGSDYTSVKKVIMLK